MNTDAPINLPIERLMKVPIDRYLLFSNLKPIGTKAVPKNNY